MDFCYCLQPNVTRAFRFAAYETIVSPVDNLPMDDN